MLPLSSLVSASPAACRMPRSSGCGLKDETVVGDCCQHHCEYDTSHNSSALCSIPNPLPLGAIYLSGSCGSDCFGGANVKSEQTSFCRRRSDQLQPTPRQITRTRRSCIVGGTWRAVTSLNAIISVAVVLVAIALPSSKLPMCLAFLPPTSLSTAPNIRPDLTTMHSTVRKRSGNHDVSTTRVRKIVGGGSSISPQQSSGHDSKLEQHQQARKQSLIEIQLKRQQQRSRRSKNVFEQFTPEYVKSPYDIDVLPKFNGNGVSSPDDKVNGAKDSSNATGSKQRKQLSQRLESLLQNDEGEEDYFADDSPQAAQQIADIRIYGKLSEEARRKATEAVKEVKDKRATKGVIGDNDREMTAATPVRKKRTSTVRATVKETGSDSISNYIKSLGQHELLYKADELLLGRQVKLLMQLEETRKGLEEKFLT